MLQVSASLNSIVDSQVHSQSHWPGSGASVVASNDAPAQLSYTQEILLCLKRNGQGLTIDQIMLKTGIKPRSLVNSILTRLEQQERVSNPMRQMSSTVRKKQIFIFQTFDLIPKKINFKQASISEEEEKAINIEKIQNNINSLKNNPHMQFCAEPGSGLCMQYVCGILLKHNENNEKNPLSEDKRV